MVMKPQKGKRSSCGESMPGRRAGTGNYSVLPGHFGSFALPARRNREVLGIPLVPSTLSRTVTCRRLGGQVLGEYDVAFTMGIVCKPLRPFSVATQQPPFSISFLFQQESILVDFCIFIGAIRAAINPQRSESVDALHLRQHAAAVLCCHSGLLCHLYVFDCYYYYPEAKGRHSGKV